MPSRKRRPGLPKPDSFRRIPPQALASIRAAERQKIRADALKRFARFNSGKPAICTPPAHIVQATADAGKSNHKGKVIFNTVADAEQFAALVAGLDGKAQSAYMCPWSRHGHAHLTTDH